MDIIETHNGYIHYTVADTQTNFKCALTVVYGSSCSNERQALWTGLINLGKNITTPWCLCGDSNNPLMQEDRIGGQPVVDAETREFQQLIDSLVLTDIKDY